MVFKEVRDLGIAFGLYKRDELGVGEIEHALSPSVGVKRKEGSRAATSPLTGPASWGQEARADLTKQAQASLEERDAELTRLRARVEELSPLPERLRLLEETRAEHVSTLEARERERDSGETPRQHGRQRIARRPARPVRARSTRRRAPRDDPSTATRSSAAGWTRPDVSSGGPGCGGRPTGPSPVA